MIARCPCGSVFWAEPPFSCCPGCDEPALVRSPAESPDEFVERVGGYARTRAEIRALPEARRGR
jgi:hypothetical protein